MLNTRVLSILQTLNDRLQILENGQSLHAQIEDVTDNDAELAPESPADDEVWTTVGQKKKPKKSIDKTKPK